MTSQRPNLIALLLVGVAGTVLLSRSAAAQSQYVRTVEDRDHVTVMEFGGVYDRQPEANQIYETQVRQAVAREFLRTHTDDYDFVVVFTRFNYSLGTDSEGAHVGGRYYAIKNDVGGIGQELFDQSAQWGSGTAQLQGFVDMGVLSRLATDPTDAKFEQTLSILAHELLHRWGSRVRFKTADGSISTDLIGREGAHWNFLLNTHNSVHYGQEWRDNGDGTFTSVGRAMAFYSPLDLYVMGMLEKSQVPPFFLIRNPDIAPSRLPEVGATITGTKQTFTIDDVVAAEGERVPSAATAPKRFKVGFVFLVRPGEQAEGLELAAINAVRDAFSTRMLILTGGKGVVQVYPEQPPTPTEPPTPITPPSSGPRTGPVDLAQALDWILSRQAVDGSFGDSSSTRVRDTSAALDLLREVPSVFTSYQKGLAWMSQLQEQLNVDMVSRRLLAIRPQFSATDAAFLGDARNASGGWGLRKGFQSDPLDTALALAASPTPGVADDLAYLLGTQNADGGWGVRPGSASSIQGTLAALRLQERYADAATTAATARAQQWLVARQNGDGGFGQSGSTVYETADAVLYLLHTNFPKPQIAVALEYLRAKQLADGSWNESAYQTALAVRALKVADLPNASIAPSGITPSVANPVDGQAVTVRAVVVNDGVQDVQNLTVALFDGDPAAGGVQIGADVVVANLPALSQLPVTFAWDTTGKAGAHRLFVVLDRLAQIAEFNEADNAAAIDIAVKQPPVEPDLAIAQSDISFIPAMLQSIPQDQTIAAAIANGGQKDANGVVVSVFEGDPALGKKVGEATVNVPGRSRAHVTIPFAVTTAGEHRYYVLVDAANQIAEDDETNNVAFATLPVQGTHDFLVVPGSLSVSENPTTLGQDVTVTAQVTNQGTTDAFAVAVRIFVDDPGGAIDIASRSVDLPAGGSATVTAVWRTARALNAVPLAVVVDPANAFPESAETNNRAALPLTVASSSEPNLHVAPASVQVTTPVNEGDTATISLPVLNNGASAVANVTVAFFLGLPSTGGVQIGATQTIAQLAAGAQATASVAWTPAGHGDRLIYAVVDAANAIAEFDEADNSAFVTVPVRSRPDLAVSAAAIAFTPAFPKEGDQVVAIATITNAGDQPAPARVRFFDGDPAHGGAQIGGDQLIASIAGRGQAQAQVSFASGTAAVRAIVVQVDPLNEVAELDETNNVAFRTLGVQNGSFLVSNVYISPNGDGRQDSTELFFRFDAPQTLSAVTIYNAQRKIVRTIDLGTATTASSSATWDGRDDKGRVAPDGSYDLAVTSAAGVDLGSARVVVDTNNLPIGAALGSKFLLNSNLTCGFTYDAGNGYYTGFAKIGWMPDDSGLVEAYQSAAITRVGGIGFTDKQVGIYVVSPDGATTTRITPDSWTVHPPAGDGTHLGRVYLSPDGRKVLVILQKYRMSFGRQEFFGPVELWVVNTDGSGLRKIADAPLDSIATGPEFAHIHAYWAPNAERVAYAVNFGATFGVTEARIYVAQADGSGQALVRTIDEVANSLEDITWSPDSSRLLFSIDEPFEPTYSITNLYSTRPDGTDEKKIASGVYDLGSLGPGSQVNWLSATRIAFVTSGELTPGGYFGESNSYQVYLLSLDGTAPQLVSRGGGPVDDVAASPAHDALAFSERLGGFGIGNPKQERVWIVSADGEARNVYESGESSNGLYELGWSGDGRHLSWLEDLITAQHTCNNPEGSGTYPCPDTIVTIGSASLDTGSATIVPVQGPGDGTFRSIGLFPDGASYLFIGDDNRLSAVGIADGVRTVISDDPYADWDNAEFSPSGKYLLYQSGREAIDQASACWKGVAGADEFAMSSLLNLTAQVGFKRDRAQLSVRGTAQDANFSRYQLEYAPVSDAANWTPIGSASDVAVVNDALSDWIPPSAGSFYVRLTAEDKAGNVATTRQRITWGVAPTITNVSVAPRIFSPNGDSARDTVTVDYVVLGPANLTFEIFNDANALVRAISQSHTQYGAGSIAWDGRDSGGQFVPNGSYRVHVRDDNFLVDYDFFVTADTTAPSVAVTLGSGFHTIPQRIVCADPEKGVGCITIPGPLVETPYFELGGSVSDPQIAGWKLEAGAGTNPADWQFAAEGGDNHAAQPVFARLTTLDAIVNKRYRLTAIDQAGNRSVAVSDFAPQELILFAYDGSAVTTAAPIEQRLGAHALSLAYTGRAAAQTFTIQYRLHDTPLWGNGATIAAAAAGADLPWDNSALSPGKIYDVRVVSTDVNGAQVVSNAIQIRSNVFVMLPFNDDLKVVPGIISLTETIKTLTLVRAGDDVDITSSTTYSGAVDFLMQAVADPSIPACSSRTVSARFKAIGVSGKVYYSNTGAIEQFPPPSMVSCPGQIGFGGTLELKISTQEALACGAAAPGLTQISVVADGVIEPKLFVQQVPNGLLQPVAGLSLQLNTLAMPEGVYDVRVTGKLPQEGQPEISKSATFVVDRHAPASQITYPATNQAFCPSKANNRSVVAVEGVAEDPNFKRFVVEYGFGDNPQNWVAVTPDSSSAPPMASRRGVLGAWDVTDLPTGTYSLRERAYDQGGNLSCSAVSFFLPGPVNVQNTRADVRLISPNGDGVSDSTLVTYQLPSAATITVRVYAVRNGQRAAAPMRTLFANALQPAGANSFVWDGLADGGVRPEDGTYVVVVSGSDTCGSTSEGAVEIVVDATRPDALIVSPTAGASVGIVTDVRGTVTDAHFQSYRLEVGEGDAPIAWTLLASGSAPVQNALVGTWTRSAAAAAFTLRLTATDAAGNTRVTLLPVAAGASNGLVSALGAQPAIFSPNLDGRADETTIEYHTGADARVRLDVLDSSDAVVRILTESDALSSSGYSFQWDGRNTAGARVADGTYTVRLTATAKADASRTQTERTTVVVDTTAPNVSATVPADGAFVHGDIAVTGAASDANLDTYAVSYTPALTGLATTVDQGRQSRTDYVFGALAGLADGRYSVTLAAKDLAQNSATKTVTFTVDNTAPQASIASPAANAVFGGHKSTVDVRGTVQDVNLVSWTLRVGAGADPQAWTPLATGTAAIAAATTLAAWNAASVADGVYTLSLAATDKAGLTTDSRVAVSVDNTPPTAQIAQPANQARIGSGADVRGTANDAHFKSAVVELSPGDAATAARFSPLAELTQPVTNGTLLVWQALPPDGVYTLRLRVEDELGHTAEAHVQVTIDTEPPRPASSLTAAVEAKKNARLTWTASPDADVAGYNVYRDGAKITSSPVDAATYLDQNLAEARYRYVVKAVDRSGLEGSASNEATLQINLTPPAARIQSPATGSTVSGIVEVRGTAAATDDFKEYRVLVAAGATPGVFTLLRRSPAPITGGLLAEYDTAGKPDGSVVSFKLEAEDVDGNVATDQITVAIDNVAPAPPVLVSAVASGSDATVQWQANHESDLAGYLLYNNDLLANARRIVTGSLTPYLLSATTFADKALPDGNHKYYLVAVDRAGNISAASNALSVSIETRAPRATITQPGNNARTEKSVLLVATTADEDIARVQFQFKAAAAATWTNLGAPVTSLPYQITWDPAGLPYGTYQFRAIATDTHNNADAAPPAITITLRDLTPPGAPAALSVLVSEGTATLTWPAVSAADLDGYAVYRRSGAGAAVRVGTSLVTGTTFADTALADGSYIYTVRAVDTSTNESDPSPEAVGPVNTPAFTVLAACVASDSFTVAGFGVAPGATVSLVVTTAAGQASLGTTPANSEGAFTFQSVPLAAGANAFTVQATDAAGNTSKRSDALTITRSDLPSTPTHVAATTNATTVTLTWDANAAVAGYVLTRDDTPLTTTSDVASTGTASSSSRDSFSTRPALAIDGDTSTFWMPSDSDAAPWWELSFPAPVLLSTIDITWAQEDDFLAPGIASSLDLQRWDGSSWITVKQIRNNTAIHNTIALATPVFASNIRIANAVSDYLVQLADVRVFRRNLITAATFTDASAGDGRHTYRLTAMNACGLEGPPAEVAVGVGDVTPPGAPTALTVDAPADGALDLTWRAPADTVAGYRVLRSETAGGPYVAVTTELVQAFGYHDAAVVNGTRYFYVVKAVDAAGNASEASNEANGTPADRVAPVQPVLLYPTDAAHPRAIATAATTIAGVTEAGSTVTLLTDGLSVAQAKATSAPISDVLAIEGINSTSDFLPSDSLLVTFTQPPNASASALTLVDTMSGATRTFAQAADGSDPVFSANGSAIVYVNGSSTIGLFDRATGQLTTIERPRAVTSPALSPDAKTIAFVEGLRPTMKLMLLDIATGAARVLATSAQTLREPKWSPAGTSVAFTEYTGSTQTYALKIADVATGTIATIDALSAGEPPSFSPDGAHLAFTSVRNARQEVWIQDLASGNAVPMANDTVPRQSPTFSPDGTAIAYLQTTANATQLRVRDLASGTEVLMFGNADARPVWTLDRGLLLPSFQQVRRIRPAGAFRFDAVALPLEQNVFSAVAADAAGNVSMPAAPIALLHDRASLPDLVTSDDAVVVYPRFPRGGESVRISAAVRNDGDVAANSVVVGFFLRGADGRLASIGSRSIVTLAAHQQSVAALDWQPAALTGGQDIVVRIDPANAIVEASELNNDGAARVVITPDGAPALSVAVDHATYQATDRVVIDAEAANPGAPADFVLEVRIEDANGFLVASVETEPLPAFGYTSRHVRALWPAGSVFAGSYRARAVLRRAEGGELTAAAAFSIVADRRAEVTIATDRADYTAGDLVQLSTVVRNVSGNADLGPLTVHVRIVDADNIQVFGADRDVALLLTGGRTDLPSQWVASLPGAFSVEVTVTQDGQQLADAHSDFAVTGVARLRGQLAVSPSPVAARASFTIAAQASNTGTLGVAGGTLHLVVLDVERQQAVRQLDRAVDLLAGAIVPWQASVSSAGLELKTYTVLLQLESAGAMQTLASSSVSIVDRQAPTVAIVAPAAGTLANADVHITAAAADDASGVARAEVRFDGGPWTAMTLVDAATGRFTATFPANAGTEGAHAFSVRAFDGAGNSDLTATDDANPVSGAFAIDVTPPAITVSGVEDGVTYTAAVRPTVSVAGAASVTTLLDAQPFESGTQVTDAGLHTLTVVANDAAGNVATVDVHFTVQHDGAPTAKDQAVTTAEDQPRELVLEGTVANGSPVTFVVVTPPAHGQLTGAAPRVTYLPAPDFFGADSFTFTVSDGSRTSDAATVSIAVTPVNDPPVADAGRDVNVTLGQTVTVDATGSRDPEGSVIGYSWQIVATPDGSAMVTASLSDRQSPRPSFTPDVAGTYTLALVVNDGALDSAPDMVAVHAEPPADVAPNANAGAGQRVLVGTTVTVNGSQSSDPDDGPQPLTYRWRFMRVPADSLVTDSSFANPFAAVTTFVPDAAGEYVVALTVSDGAAESTDDVRVAADLNTAPVANAGPDTTIKVGETAQLDGSASSDADGGPEPLHYAWTIVSTPSGSAVTNASIAGANTARASLVPDVGGVYVLALTVRDGASSSSDNVAVTVQATQHATGAAYYMHAGFQEKLSLDVLSQNGAITDASWLKYYYVKTRSDVQSTRITSFVAAGGTATVAGEARLNGVAGYRFVATIVDGAPDGFGITITRPDGTLFYQYSATVASGDLVITTN